MRYLKSLGLAAIVAAAFTALLGAGSASGAVLCKVTATPCGAGNIYSGALKTSTTSAVFRNSEGTAVSTCMGSELGGKIEQAGGAAKPVVVGTNYLVFTGCSTKTFVIRNTATLNINQIAGSDNGAIEGKGELTVTIKIEGSECNYVLGNTMIEFGTFKGGKPAVIDLSTTLAKYSIFEIFCPGEVSWEGKYSVTEPASTTLHSQAE